MKLINILFNELQIDLENFINFIIIKYKRIIKWTLLKKLSYVILIMSTLLLFYIYIIFWYYALKYFFKYLFIISDYFWNNIILIKYYSNLELISGYFHIYIYLKIIITNIFFYLPYIIKMIIKNIRNFFFIKYWIIHYIKKYKKYFDRKLYNVYVFFEYIFEFSYIYEWQEDMNTIYIPKYKKYKKIYIIFFLERTTKIRKKIYIFYLYFLNIKRIIFWLYIKEIYLDLLWTSIKIYIYYILILIPLTIYIYLKAVFRREYMIWAFNRKEWLHVRPVYHKYYFRIFKLVILYEICSLFLNLFFICSFIFLYIFEYTYSYFLYNLKLTFHAYYFIKLASYESLRIWIDLYFQYYTLFLYNYLHCDWDINISFKIIISLIIANYRYFYFNVFHYKLYILLAFIALINL